MAGEWIEIEDDFRGYLTCPVSGKGPGLLLLQEIFGVTAALRELADRLAGEGWVVLVPDLFWRFEPGIELADAGEEFDQAVELYRRFSINNAITDIGDSLEVLRSRPEQIGKAGCLGFCLGGTLAYLTAAETDVDCAVAYYGVGIEDQLDRLSDIHCPLMLHLGEEDGYVPEKAQQAIARALEGKADATLFRYPDCDHGFAAPGREAYDRAAAGMAHTRTLSVLRGTMGPHYDLSALWDAHTAYEFATRDVDATMATMVESPYVNHIPTMTGGVGYEGLSRFYREHFVFSNPPDTRLIPISRTVGVDRVVDEMVFCFTHTCEVPWLLPGVPPTGKAVEVPLVAIVNFRGDKLYHEHIYWDQASVLAQIGWLDPETLPIAGVETARKLLDESLPSNALMDRKFAPPAGSKASSG